jgi:dTDP-4-dehydrorhamnose reductase
MRAVVIGKSGQLARCLSEAAPTGVTLTCLGRSECDLASPTPDFRALGSLRPAIVINAAAYTAVDKAESERDAAFALNTRGPAHLAAFAAARAIPLIHISTDYVFDGSARRPYAEDDTPAPVNIYGLSKLEGERAVQQTQPESIILRTSWLFSARGGNFLKTMLRLAGERERLRIVADQFGCPTSAHELADCLWMLAGRIIDAASAFRQWGIYHYAGAGATSWADFAEAIFACPDAGLARIPAVERVTSQAYPTAARRPLYSVLNCAKIGERFNIHPAHWENAIPAILRRIRAGGFPGFGEERCPNKEI